MQNKQPQPKIWLTPASGVFLDVIRLTAALDVAFTHARAIWFREREFDLIPSHFAHGSVIVFFVLSGYVIAYTTTVKKRTAKEYAVARLSRLYSGILPALLFTAIAAFTLSYIAPGLLAFYAQNKPALRYVIAFFFCNEVWFFSAAPLINGVIWSLSYEFWFYVLYGSWLFRLKKGWWPAICAILIAGPKILIMMPIWLLGMLAYKLPKPNIGGNARAILITFFLLASVLTMIFLPQLPYVQNTSRLYWASSFLSDYAAAFCIAFSFWLLPLTGAEAAVTTRKTSLVRKIADLTFPIYVFHYPCLVLCRAFINLNNYGGVFFALALTLLFCYAAGQLVDKWHRLLPRFFENLFSNKFIRRFLSIKNKIALEA